MQDNLWTAPGPFLLFKPMFKLIEALRRLNDV
jgi:hypothetical protein